MDFPKKQLNKLQQNFVSLTASQKMLAVSLVVIMAMTLLWWAKYAGQAEMEEVIPTDFATEDLGRITGQLTSKGIPAKANGSRIMVPADRKIEALSYLSFAQLLPRDTSSAFEDIISKMSSPIDPPSKTDSIHNHAREVMLAQMIRYFPKVRSAMVAIDPNIRRGFEDSVMPTATVTIQLNPSEKPDKRLVLAAADVVCGSVAGMERKRVKVIIDGASQPIDDGEFGNMSGTTLMDRIRDWETYYSRQVQDQLFYIDGAMVHVSVALNDEHTQTFTKSFDPKGTVKAEKTNSSENDESTTTSHGPSDPGLNANGGPISVPTPASGGDQIHSTHEKNGTTFDNSVAGTETKTSRDPGTPTIKSASVSLPRSYFAKKYQINMGTDKEPTRAVLDPYIDEQLPVFRKQVAVCLALLHEDNVAVTTYTDVMPVTPSTTAQASSGVSMLIGGHVKEIALGALALVSLFMVSTMVRKSSAVAQGIADDAGDDTVAGAKAKGKANAGDDTAEVGEGVSTLDGVEMDSESIRGQQMMDQVTTLVKENPDAAANLVKRWLNRA